MFPFCHIETENSSRGAIYFSSITLKTILILSFLVLLIFSKGFSQADCRVKSSDFHATILASNPFFSDHYWDPIQKTERAYYGKGRLLMISQSGCKRHHTAFLLVIKSEQIAAPMDSFWIQEAFFLMQTVFWEKAEYRPYQEEFEQKFAQKFKVYGLGRQFNFPIGTQNFVCSVAYEPAKGANIRVEWVRYVFEKKNTNSKG